MTTPQNGAELLARIRPVLATETRQVCLRPDLIKAWEEANTALAESRAAESTNRMNPDGAGSTASRKLAKRVQDVEAEIEANAITFTFRALPMGEWRALCDQHPPRDGNQIDHMLGHDRDAVEDAAVRACMIDPDFDDTSWAEFLAVCNPSEWAELRDAVRTVNGSVTQLPKSLLASQVLAKRATASKPRPASA
jgi:hypothetical protein